MPKGIYTLRINLFYQIFKLFALCLFWGIDLFAFVHFFNKPDFSFEILLQLLFIIPLFFYAGLTLINQLITGFKFIRFDIQGLSVFYFFKFKSKRFSWREIDGYSKGAISGGIKMKLLILYKDGSPVLEINNRDFWQFNKIEQYLKVKNKYLGESQIFPKTWIGYDIIKPGKW